MFILSFATRTANYSLVIVGFNHSWFLLSAKGADRRIHVEPLLPLELRLELLALQPRGDRHDILDLGRRRLVARRGEEGRGPPEHGRRRGKGRGAGGGRRRGGTAEGRG